MRAANNGTPTLAHASLFMTTVFIVRSDPHAAARLHAVLESTPRLRVAGVARYAFRACQLLPSSGAELLISDLRLHDGSAVSLLHELRRGAAAGAAPRPKLLLLAQTVDDALLLDALRAGADGYHIEDDPLRSLGMSIAETVRDEAVMAPSIARRVLGSFSAAAWPWPLNLSRRRARSAAAHRTRPIAQRDRARRSRHDGVRRAAAPAPHLPQAAVGRQPGRRSGLTAQPARGAVSMKLWRCASFAASLSRFE